MMGFLTLDDDNNVIRMGDDAIEWGKNFEAMRNSERSIVAKDVMFNTFLVSTVFLGLDHGFSLYDFDDMDREPVAFETMVFKIKEDIVEVDWTDLECRRCCTWKQAEAQHASVMDELSLIMSITETVEVDDV